LPIAAAFLFQDARAPDALYDPGMPSETGSVKFRLTRMAAGNEYNPIRRFIVRTTV
jgi:hypothetical protein